MCCTPIHKDIFSYNKCFVLMTSQGERDYPLISTTIQYNITMVKHVKVVLSIQKITIKL